MKNYKVRGEFRVRFEKEIEAENLNDAWQIAARMDETGIDADDEFDRDDFEIDDVWEADDDDE